MLRALDAIVRLAGLLAASSLAAVALGQAGVLVARKAGLATVWAQEAVMALAVPAVLLAVPWALREGAHVAVDAFGTRPVAARLGTVLALVLGLAVLWLAAPYALAAWRAGEGSFELSGFGYRWAPKAVLPLFGLVLALAAAGRLARS